MIRCLHPDLAAELARAHGAELRKRAEHYQTASLAIGPRPSLLRAAVARLRRARRAPAPADGVLVELRIRHTGTSDEAALRRLASLDSTTAPPPPLLIAEVDGEIQAALSLWDGRTIADPFRKTEALIELLTLRAAHIHSAAATLLTVRRPLPNQLPARPSNHTP
jgi:hypothetical protein